MINCANSVNRSTKFVSSLLLNAHSQEPKPLALLMGKLALAKLLQWWALQMGRIQVCIFWQLMIFAHFYSHTQSFLCMCLSMRFIVENFTISWTAESLYIAERTISRKLILLDFQKFKLLVFNKLWKLLEVVYSQELAELQEQTQILPDHTLFCSYN